MNTRGKFISISGILIILSTIFLFFLITDNRVTITWIGFIFILFAEIVLFGGLLLIEYLSEKTSQIIWRIGGGLAVGSYSVISIIISLIYIVLEINSIRIFLSLQLLLIVCFSIAYLIFFISANSVKMSSDKVLNSINQFNEIIDKIYVIMNDKNNSEYSKLLTKVYEELKYSDNSINVPCDNDLNLEVIKLEAALKNDNENKKNEVVGIIDNILLTINNRKFQVRNIKNGGI